MSDGRRKDLSQNKLQFYLDENMNPEIAKQLRDRGIDALSARDEKMLKTGDPEQLRFAAAAGRVLCTEDSDFTDSSFFSFEHSGIAYFPNSNLGIGYAVTALQELHRSKTPENMKNSLRFL